MSSSIVLELSKDTQQLQAILNGITHVHAACIEHDHTMATFLPPLSYDKMFRWWQGQLEEATLDGRHIWVEIQPISSRTENLPSPLADNPVESIVLEDHADEIFEVAGVVSLYKPESETGSFRGQVHKLLVLPNHRRKGVARRLMARLERTALEEGRWNLMLDTAVGSPAEQVYPRFGYIRVGVVPDYGYSPGNGGLNDEVWFYKDLKKQGTL